jgi:hypothetical protein
MSLQAPRPAGNYTYVKFDVLFKYFMNRSILMQCLSHFPSLCHLSCHRSPRCIPLYQILMRYIHLYSYVTYVSPISNHHGSHVLHM